MEVRSKYLTSNLSREIKLDGIPYISFHVEESNEILDESETVVYYRNQELRLYAKPFKPTTNIPGIGRVTLKNLSDREIVIWTIAQSSLFNH